MIIVAASARKRVTAIFIVPRILSGEGDARLAEEVGDRVGGLRRAVRPRRRRAPGDCR